MYSMHQKCIKPMIQVRSSHCIPSSCGSNALEEEHYQDITSSFMAGRRLASHYSPLTWQHTWHSKGNGCCTLAMRSLSRRITSGWHAIWHTATSETFRLMLRL